MNMEAVLSPSNTMRPEIEDVEDAHFRARFQRVVVPGSAGGLAGFLQRPAMALAAERWPEPTGGVHYEDERSGDGLSAVRAGSARARAMASAAESSSAVAARGGSADSTGAASGWVGSGTI